MAQCDCQAFDRLIKVKYDRLNSKKYICIFYFSGDRNHSRVNAMNYQTLIHIHIISSHFVLVPKACVTGDVKENEFGAHFGRYEFVATRKISP
jgi:hypothetical protein